MCPNLAPGGFQAVLCRPRRFLYGLVSPPAIFLCSSATFARNSDGLVSPPAVFQNRRGPNSGTRHLKNRRGRTRHPSQNSRCLMQMWTQNTEKSPGATQGIFEIAGGDTRPKKPPGATQDLPPPADGLYEVDRYGFHTQ